MTSRRIEAVPWNGDESRGESIHRHRLAALAILSTAPPWSWADFLGWSLAALIAGVGGLWITLLNQGGVLARKNRKTLVGTAVFSIVAGGGGVLFSWLFKFLGLS